MDAMSSSRQCPPESSLLGVSLLAALLLVFGLLHGLALMMEQYAVPSTEISRRVTARSAGCPQKTFLNRPGVSSPVVKNFPTSCGNRLGLQSSSASSAAPTSTLCRRKTVTFAETLKVHFVKPAYRPEDFYTDPPRVCLLHKALQRT